jgi:putative hemolysin
VEPSIWIAILACLAGCYIAACNIALKSFSRSKLADLLEERGRGDRVELFMQRLPKYQLVTGMIRTCLSLVVLLSTLYFVETRLHMANKVWEYALAFVVAGFLVTIFMVAIPVSWARYQRESLLAMSMRVLTFITLLLFPIAAVLHLFDPIMRRVSGAGLGEETDASEQLTDEVLSVVEDHEHGQGVDEVQKEMLEAVFDLPTTTAGEIMTPRTEIKAIPVSATLDEVKQAVLRFGHSRIPVFETSLDNIVGVLYAKDLIVFVGDGVSFDLHKVLREPFMTPESKSVRDLLTEFKARKVHLAIVLDEYGGTAGLITIEDILEEIVGDIRDEYEPQEQAPQVTRVDDATVEVDARLHIDDFNDLLDAELPEDEDYDTVAGFVAASLGHIAEPGEVFEAGGLRFTVTDAERTRVNRVRVEKLQSAAVASPPEGK